MLQPNPKFTPPSDAVVVKSANDFVPPSDAIVLKKKEDTTSTSITPPTNSELVPKNGSSATLKKPLNLTEQNSTLLNRLSIEKQLASPRGLNREERLAKSKELVAINNRQKELDRKVVDDLVTKIDDVSIDVAKENLLAEQNAANEVGVMGTLTAKAQQLGNFITTGNFKKDRYLQDDKDYIQSQYKEQIPEEKLTKMAEDLFIQKDLQKQREKNADDILQNTDPAIQEMAKTQQINKLNLKSPLLKANTVKISVIDKSYNSYLEDIKKDDEIIAKAKKEGKQLDQQFIDSYNKKIEGINSAKDQYVKLLDENEKLSEEVNGAERNLDLFKLNYSPLDKYVIGLANATQRLAGGTVAFGSEFLPKDSGLPLMNEVKDFSARLGDKLISEAEGSNKQFRQIRLDDVQTIRDFGRYTMNLIVEQTPIIASMAVGGEIGLLGLGASSGGEKINEMRKDLELIPTKYSDAQVKLTGLGYALAEAIPEFQTLSIIRGAKRTIQEVGRNQIERQLFRQGIKDYSLEILSKGGKILTNATKEGLSENLTGIMQDYIDEKNGIKVQGKKEKRKEEFVAGFIMGGGMTAIAEIPSVYGYIASQVSNEKQQAAVKTQLNKLATLEKEMLKNDLTDNDRKILSAEIKSTNKNIEDLVTSAVKKAEGMSRNQIEELVKTNTIQADLRNQAEEIKAGNLSDNIKEAKLADLKKQFSASEDMRLGIQEGRITAVDLLPIKIQDRIKRFALKELTKELNPDGTKTITITNEQILERANKLYKTEQDNLAKETKNAETEVPTAKTEQEAEVSQQAQEKKVEETNGTFYVTDEKGIKKGFATKEEAVEKLRADEQVELKSALPNAELLPDGKIDWQKLSLTDAVTYDDIYNKYDKLITPLLEDKVAPTADVVAPSVEKQSEDVKNYNGIFSNSESSISNKGKGTKEILTPNKNRKVVMMSPDDYLKLIREGLNRNIIDILKQRKGNEALIEKYEQNIKDGVNENLNETSRKNIDEAVKKGDKIDMPFVFFNEEGKMIDQDGRNRAAYAKEIGEKLIPVLIENNTLNQNEATPTADVVVSSVQGKDKVKEHISNLANDNYLFTHVTTENNARNIIENGMSVSLGTGISSTLTASGQESATNQAERLMNGEVVHRDLNNNSVAIISVPKAELDKMTGKSLAEKFENWLVENNHINNKGELAIPKEFNAGYLSGENFITNEAIPTADVVAPSVDKKQPKNAKEWEEQNFTKDEIEERRKFGLTPEQDWEPTFRGTTLSEWEEIQKGGDFKSEGLNELVFTTPSKDLAKQSGKGTDAEVIIEFKPESKSKMREGDSKFDSKEYYGDGLNKEDVLRVTDKDGNVIYEATPKTNTPTDGNVQPRAGQVAEVAIEQKPTAKVAEAEVVEPAVEPKPSKKSAEIENADEIVNFLNEEFINPKKEEKPKVEKEQAVEPIKETKIEQAKGFVSLAIDNLTTSLKDFQGRAKDYSEQTYNRIINEAKEGVLNISSIPPIQVWKNPETGKFVILAGHSRTKAFSDLAQGKVEFADKYKKSDFEKVNTQIVEAATLEEAQKIAQESNQGAVQTVVDNAKYVRESLLPTFKNPNQAKTKLKSLYGPAWARIYAYANLNPKGKAMQMLKQFQDANESDSNDKSKKIAEWTGKARADFDKLTDAHENEIFDYLSKNDKIKTYSELSELLNRRVNGLEKFNTNEPLNFEQKVGRGSNEVEIVKEIQDLKNRDTTIKKQIKDLQAFGKNINDAQRKQIKDLTAESIKINTVDIPNAQVKQKQARSADAEQFDIFSQINEQIENGNITSEQVDEFVNDDRKSEEIEPIVKAIETKAKSDKKIELEQVVNDVENQIERKPADRGNDGRVQQYKGKSLAQQENKRPGIVVQAESKMPNSKDFLSKEYEIDDVQKQGVNSALSLFDRGGKSFLLADGTGVGKTRQILVTAKEYAKKFGGKVLIISENTTILTKNFANDAKALGIDMNEFEFGTYNDLRTGKKGKDNYGLVIYDEAHNLKNQESGKAIAAGNIKSKNNMYVTATPMDTIGSAVYFISEVSGVTEEQAYNMLGLNVKKQKDAVTGQEVKIVTLQEGVAPADIKRNIVKIREEIISKGAMLRREYPFYGEFVEDQISLTEEQSNEQDEIESSWDDRIEYESTTDDGRVNFRKKMNLSGQKSGELSRWSESTKIKYTFKEVVKAIKDGKKVVVIAEGVNETTITAIDKVVPGFLSELSKMLKAEGYKVAEIFGKSDKGEANDKFQSNEVDVVLGTAKSASTGIDLDDQNGNSPRVLFMVTPNYSGNVFQQILGRVSRRNTKSPAQVRLLFNESNIDARRKQIVNGKLQTLKAIQEGVIDDEIEIDIQEAPIPSADVTVNLEGITLEDISEKAFAVKGDTKTIKDNIKALGGRYNPKYGWIFPKSKKAEVQEMLNNLAEKNEPINEAKKLSDQVRKLKIDLSKLSDGGLQSNPLGLPVAVWNASMDIIAASIDAGMEIGEAIKRGLNYIQKNNRGPWDKKAFNDEVLKELGVRGIEVNGQDIIVKPQTKEDAKVVDGFYSDIEKSLIDTKKDNLTATEWETIIGKTDEAKFTGLTDFINSKKRTISKAEIKEYLDNNRIEISEVVLGGNQDNSTRLKEIEDELTSKGYSLETDMGGEGIMLLDEEGELVEYDEIPSDVLSIYEEYTQKSDSDFNPASTVRGKFEQYQLEGEKENYKEVLVTLPSKGNLKERWGVFDKNGKLVSTYLSESKAKDKSKSIGGYYQIADNVGTADPRLNFKSSHFDEANILVHLRMNTRTDADGKKVLFLEEVQSDWGQQGKKEGFETPMPIKLISADELLYEEKNLTNKQKDWLKDFIERWDKAEDTDKLVAEYQKWGSEEKLPGIPQAPFVMETGNWANLGIKVALKEAVKQGATKIAWTTGEQQNERYDLSKSVDLITVGQQKNGDKFVSIDMKGQAGESILYYDNNGNIIENDGKSIPNTVGKNLSDVIGKEITEKILKANKGDEFKGEDLRIGGKGMKGFYGSPKESALGIIGEVAKALTKQEPKTIKIKSGEKLKLSEPARIEETQPDKFKSDRIYTVFDSNGNKLGVFTSYLEASRVKTAKDNEIKEGVSTQYSIDITPELKSEVEKGLPMFGNLKEQQKAMVNAEVDKIAQKIKDFLPSAKGADGLKAQGFSQDQIIDVVANAVKALISKGIDVNEAIKQVIASIKERFNVDVDEALVKAKLNITDIPQDFEREQGRKSVLNRMASGNSSIIKKAIAKYSLDYEIENQKEAKAKAEMFVNEVGVDNALIAVRKGLIDGATGAFVYARTIEILEQEINSLKGEDRLDAIADYQKLLGEISDELDNRSRSNGRFIAALAEIYNSSGGRYNLTKMVNDYKAQNNGEISKEVLEKLKNVEEKLKESEEKLAELEAKKRIEEENEAFNNILESVARKKAINTKAKITDKQKLKLFADKLRSFKISNLGGANVSTPFSIAYDLAIETAAQALELTGLVSDAIKAGVDSIRNAKLSKDEQEQALSDLFDLFDDSEVNVPTSQKGMMSINEEGMLRIPNSLIREKVENGVDNIDDLVSELMTDVQELFPDSDFTEREVRDIVTGYGKISNPTSDEIEIQISIMKSLGKIASGIEDAYSGQRPLRSGQQRREPTVKERTEMKKLKALLRDLPLADADITKAYKTALDAIKKRLSNEIEELDEQIANGEKRKGQKSVIEYDQEAKDLKAERDAKKELLDEMVGKPELTEQQKIDRAEKTLQKRLDDLQQKIDSNEIDYAKKPETVTSTKLEEMRKLKKEYEAQIQKMREDAGMAEARLIEIAKRNATKRLATLKERIANGDFEKRKRKPTPTDVELNKIKSEIAQQKEIFDKEVYKLELKNRRIEQKALDLLKDILSVPKILSFTADLSFVGIQNATQIYKMSANSLINLAKTGKLKGTFRDSMAKTFKAMASPNFEQKFMQAVKANPNYELWKDSKLGIVESHYKESAKAEVFQNNALSALFSLLGNYVASKGYEKTGNIIKDYINVISIFERGQTVFENQMRINRFQEGADLLKSQGFNPIDDIQEYKKVAAAVNTLTGRANTGSKAASALREFNGILFSSFSNWAAGVNQLNPYWYYTLTPTARKMALTDVAHHIIGAGSMISLAALYALGQDDDDEDKVVVETDPTSSDFAIIKVGNLRIDPWAGKKTTVVAFSRLIYGEKKDKYGNLKKYGIEYDDEDWVDLPLEYAGNKIAPGPRFALDRFFRTKKVEYKGTSFREDKYGTDFKKSKYLVPLIFENFREVNEEQPGLFGKATMALSWTGLINTNVYGGMQEGFKDMPDDLLEKEYKVKIQKVKDNEKILEFNLDKLTKDYIDKKISKFQIMQKVDSLVVGDAELFNKSMKSVIKKVNKEELKSLVTDPFYLGLKKEKNPEIQAILFYGKFKDDKGMSAEDKKERDKNLRYVEFDFKNPRFIRAYQELRNKTPNN